MCVSHGKALVKTNMSISIKVQAMSFQTKTWRRSHTHGSHQYTTKIYARSISLDQRKSSSILMNSPPKTIKVSITSDKGALDEWDDLTQTTSIITRYNYAIQAYCKNHTNWYQTNKSCHAMMKPTQGWSKKCMHEVDTCYRDSIGSM